MTSTKPRSHDIVRLRPFHEFVSSQGEPPVEIVGRIVGQHFVVSALGAEGRFTTLETGEDSRGSFALVPEATLDLIDGFKVRVEVEHDEHGLDGGIVDVFLDGAVREAAETRLRAMGLDPETRMLIAPYRRFLSIYFHSDGTPEKHSAGLVGEPPN